MKNKQRTQAEAEAEFKNWARQNHGHVYTAPDGTPSGVHRFRRCDLCGHTEWYCAEDNRGGEFTVIIDGELTEYPSCPKCLEIKMRAPELFQWVLNVIDHHTQASPTFTKRGG